MEQKSALGRMDLSKASVRIMLLLPAAAADDDEDDCVDGYDHRANHVSTSRSCRRVPKICIFWCIGACRRGASYPNGPYRCARTPSERPPPPRGRIMHGQIGQFERGRDQLGVVNTLQIADHNFSIRVPVRKMGESL